MGDMLSKLLGSDFMKLLGSEGFGNLIKGGTALYGGMQAGDMMDFQKSLANKSEARTETLFQQDQEDRERNKNLDFS